MNVQLKLEKFRGKWYARGKDARGKAVRKSLLIDSDESETVAHRKMALLELEMEKNGGHSLTTKSELKVWEFIDLYHEKGIADTEAGKVKLIGRYWNKFNVSSVNEASMLAWQRDMQKRGIGSATIKRYGSVLKAVMNYGWKSSGLACVNLPTIGQDNPARNLNITNEDRDLIIGQMGDDDRRFFTVLAFTGARPSELIRLRWKDVNVMSGMMSLQSYKGKSGGPMVRTIPMSGAVSQVMKEIDEGAACQRNDYVFKMLDGRAYADFAWSTHSMGWRLKRAAKQAGFEVGLKHGITLYAFRHTFGTNAGKNASTNPFTLSAYMGHKNVQTTKDNYFHGGVSDAEQLVAGLG